MQQADADDGAVSSMAEPVRFRLLTLRYSVTGFSSSPSSAAIAPSRPDLYFFPLQAVLVFFRMSKRFRKDSRILLFNPSSSADYSIRFSFLDTLPLYRHFLLVSVVRSHRFVSASLLSFFSTPSSICICQEVKASWTRIAEYSSSIHAFHLIILFFSLSSPI